MRQLWFDIGSVWGGGSAAAALSCQTANRRNLISCSRGGPITPSHHKYSRKITSWVDMILAFFGRYPGRAPNVFSCKIQHHVITFNCRQCHGKPGADKKENTVDRRDICKRAKILAQSMTIEDVVFWANYYEVATSRSRGRSRCVEEAHSSGYTAQRSQPWSGSSAQRLSSARSAGKPTVELQKPAIVELFKHTIGWK